MILRMASMTYAMTLVELAIFFLQSLSHRMHHFPMRQSYLRHPLAILRQIIQLSQPEFARLVGLSESTVSKIESLRLELSEEIALLIESETGCSARWLLNADPTRPPLASVIVTESGTVNRAEPDDDTPFTLEVFQWVRSRKRAGLPLEADDPSKHFIIADAVQELLRACHHAEKKGKRDYAQAKLYGMVQSFSKDLGVSDPWDDDFIEYMVTVLDSVVHITQLDNYAGD
jgi:transcriptional regulator with XRE-family HTH domain